MLRKNNLYESLFCLFAGTLYAYVLCAAILNATVLQFSDMQVLWLCACCVFGFTILFFNRYTMIASASLFILAVLVVFIFLKTHDYKVQWYREALQYIQDIVNFFIGSVPHRPQFDAIVRVALAVSVSFITVFFFRVYYSFYALTALALVIFIVPAYNRWPVSELHLGLFALCFVLLLAKKLHNYTDDDYEPNALYALLLIPVCLLVFGLSWRVPKPQVSAEAVKEQITQSADTMLARITPAQVALYSDTKKLGGPARLNDFIVMYVTAEEPVYLRGNVRDTYNGHTWTSQYPGNNQAMQAGENEWFDTAMPPQLASQQLYYMRFYGRQMKSVSIDMRGTLRTNTVFTPPLRVNLGLNQPVKLFQNEQGEIKAPSYLPKNIAYTQQYISWDSDNAYYAALLRTLSAAPSDMPEYLALPDSLPQRVRDLAEELTKDAPDQYTKLKTLEAYLKQFPYTLTPPEVPEDSDFVDYFLFEQSEGYCVYYASALAVMARCVGIPTRYVEGYILPAGKNADGQYVVTNRQAHAWVEAFFPGFGWVNFEATSGYALTEQAAPAPQQAPVRTPAPTPQQQTTPQQTVTDSPSAPASARASATGKVLAVLLLAAVLFAIYGLRSYRIWRREAAL